MGGSRIAGDYFASGVATATACRPTQVCQERGIVVSEWRVGVGDVGILVSRIFDSSRDGALVVVSPASDTNRPRIDTKLLAQRLAPGTELAVLDSMTASERLSDTVDPQFQVYGGGIRVILAGAARTDHWRRHRLFRVYPGDDADGVYTLVIGRRAQPGAAVPDRLRTVTVPASIREVVAVTGARPEQVAEAWAGIWARKDLERDYRADYECYGADGGIRLSVGVRTTP